MPQPTNKPVVPMLPHDNLPLQAAPIFHCCPNVPELCLVSATSLLLLPRILSILIMKILSVLPFFKTHLKLYLSEVAFPGHYST